MEKLREAIKDVPCNSLSRVYPYQLQEWTDVMSGEEFEEVVQELIDENLLDEKYDFQCDCGNECTVYASKLLEKGYCCPECEREYGKEEVVNKGTVVYDIDKRAVMGYNLGSIDAKSRIRKIIEYESHKRKNEMMQQEYAQADVSQQEKKVKVFLSYSHEDEKFKEKLDQHLAPLKRNGKITTWNDGKLLPGSELDAEIKEQLRQADIIILMISSSFFNSDYCWETEMSEAIKRAKNGECRIIPVIVRECMWEATEFRGFLALPKDGKPINEYGNEDKAYTEIARRVNAIIEEIRQENDK